MRDVQAEEEERPPAEEEPIVPVRGAREEEEGCARGSSKSLRSANEGVKLVWLAMEGRKKQTHHHQGL